MDNLRKQLLTPFRLEIFWSHTKTLPSGCVVWTAAENGKGYGKMYLGKIDGKKVFEYVHRIGHVIREGDIPDGFEVDHTCHDPNVCNLKNDCPHRKCVIHTEAVPHRTNVQRQMRELCSRDHPYTHIRYGKRFCQTCNTLFAANKRRLKKLEQGN